MKMINIVWCDDNIDTLYNENIEELFARHNCKLFRKAKTARDLKKIFEESFLDIDAVIVDFNVGETELIPANDSASGFRWVHEHLEDYSPIPFYLYSARDFDFIKEKYKSFEYKMEGDYFFKSNKNVAYDRNRYFQTDELEQLIVMAENEVSTISTPEYKIRCEFSEAFACIERFSLDSNVFLQILLSDESIDRYDLCHKANPLRMVLEEMTSKLGNKGIIPSNCDFNSLPSLLHGKQKDSNRYSSNDYMHESLYEAFVFLAQYTQDGSHSKNYLKLEFHNYIKTSGDIYLVKALAIIALDIIEWMGRFYDKYEDLQPFSFTPFIARALKIDVINGKEGAIVKDTENKTYFVQQPPNPKYKYSIGCSIEVTDRRPTTKEFGDYYAFGKNCDVK